MQFFAENTLDEVLLCSLGMDGKESRVRLIGFFESVLCITRTDVVASFSEFIRCLAQKVAELEDLRARILVLQGHVDGLHAASLSVGSELEALRSRVLLSDSRASELSTINDQLKVALEAYKEKVGKYKRHALEKDETIRTLRAEMESYDRRLSKCLADASTADTLSSARVKEMEIKWSRSLLRQRALARRVSFFRREIGKVKTHWTKWSGRSAILGRRCGCGQSIRYFERTRIDLEWITEEAARASAGFQVELKTTAEAMRAEIQVVHDERDDALADCSVYIDRLLLSDKELRRSIIRNSELLAELSVVKAEFARRGGSDRALLKAQLFAGAGGRALVCPVPTVDGELVQVADVYRGWMVSGGSGGGCGLGAGFVSPLSGGYALLMIAMMIRDTDIFSVVHWQALSLP